MKAAKYANKRRELAIIDVQQRIRACRLCQEQGFIAVAHPIVNGGGTDRVLVIGQAPGHRSVAKDLPFSGPGGRILQKWLEQAGFPAGYLHEHTYLSSLTRCDPGRSPKRNGDRRPSPAEVALCRPFLDEELQALEPRVVLLVGTMAIEAYFSHAVGVGGKLRRLEEIIGTFEERDGACYLPLPHPSGVSRWLNEPAHQALLQQALAFLANWRAQFEL